VYDRHSEAKEIEKWEKPEDIDRYLSNFKQHSLRNPIVEQVITETLRTVRDIWRKEGHIDEIHVELGREMKNPADKRRQMTERIQQNENTNLRIKALLMEFMNPEMGIENVRPFSPSQQDILRIYEENALDNLKKEDTEYEFVTKISKMAQPSKSDIIRYKCWLEQKYRSPYTGRILLSNIVREKTEDGEYEQEAVSKNLISCNGSITDRLKKDWGMNDVWNHIILPRFQRLNQITGKDCFTTLNREGHEIPNMPFELQRGFSKKRIDHRHHAMDAIVIACATRDHVNLLNNEASLPKHQEMKHALSRKLRRCEEVVINGKKRNIYSEFLSPWPSFTTDAWQTLQNIIVSFKQNLRVINKTTNAYLHYDESGKKKPRKQVNGDSWAVRKSMHKDTVFGEVNLRKKKTVSLNEAIKKPISIVNKDFKKKVMELLAEGRDAKFIKKYVEEHKDVWSDINTTKIEVYYFTKDEKKRNGEPKERYFATRKPLDSSFDQKKIVESVTDTGIQKILLAHLEAKGNNSEQAFSPDGIDEMNRNIVELNKGKFHQPILKVRVYEKADKFAVGKTGNKTKKFVEAAKGTNLFWAILGSENTNDETGETVIVRSYLTIPLNIMIDCQKKYESKWKENVEAYLKEIDLINAEDKVLFTLSPNDLVYLPTKEELQNKIESVDRKRIYKYIDPGMNTGNFIPFYCAKTIFSTKFSDQKKIGIEIPIQDEYGLGSQSSKSPRAITDEMIKETCIPIKVDRLGNIIELNGVKR